MNHLLQGFLLAVKDTSDKRSSAVSYSSSPVTLSICVNAMSVVCAVLGGGGVSSSGGEGGGGCQSLYEFREAPLREAVLLLVRTLLEVLDLAVKSSAGAAADAAVQFYEISRRCCKQLLLSLVFLAGR